MTLLRTAATDASDARALATASAEQAELVRAQWTAAAQRTKGLERLRERHREALQHAEDAAEERAVDDLVTGRAGRAATDPTPRRSRGRSDRRSRPGSARSRPASSTARTADLRPTGRRAAVGRRADRHRRDLRRYGATAGTASESAVVAEAQKYLGVPYLWGGTDPAKGLDCSGFTQLVFGNLGIDLPRTSSQQATAGTRGRLAGRRPPRRPRLLRPLLVAGRHRPRRHLHRQRQDDRRPAARRGRQGAGRRQPDRHPPGPARSSAAPRGRRRRVRAGRRPLRRPVHPRRPAATASTPRCWRPSPRRSRTSTPRAVSPAGAQGLMQFMPATAQGLGRQPARPGVGRSTAPPATSAA